MKKAQKIKPVKDTGLQKQLKEIDSFFRDLEKDKTLPTFGEFFMRCLILNVAENVNLKQMYPAPYEKLNTWLRHHNDIIRALQRVSKE